MSGTAAWRCAERQSCLGMTANVASADSLAGMDQLDWDAVDAIDWAAFETTAAIRGGPSGYVPDSLRLLVAARDRDTARAGARSALDAISHDHSGVLFPVVLPALPFLAKIAVGREPWPSSAAVQLLIDVVDFSLQDGPASAVDAASVLTALRPWRQRLEHLAGAEADRPAPIREGARDLVARLAAADSAA